MHFSYPLPLVNPEAIAQAMWPAVLAGKGQGAIIECGVFDGCTILYNKIKLDFLPWNFRVYAADTFEGFPYDPNPKFQNTGARKGAFTPSTPWVLPLLKKYGIIPLVGMVENTLSLLPPSEQFSFVFLDLDLYRPTLFCIDFFRARMLPHGRICVHDYSVKGQKTEWAGIRKAVDSTLMKDQNFKECFRLNKSKRDAKTICFERV